MRYEINNEDNSVKIFADNQEAPIIFQPKWPNGTEWGSREEAEVWANQFIESINEDFPLNAQVGPGMPRERKLTKKDEEIRNKPVYSIEPQI